MKTVIALMLALFITFTHAPGNPAPNESSAIQTDTRRPAVAIDEALRIAENHVERHKIDVSEKYIDSAQLNLNAQTGRRHWRITYELKRSVKGGQTILFVYMDKSVEVGYGE